jgi:hypothetical protein
VPEGGEKALHGVGRGPVLHLIPAAPSRIVGAPLAHEDHAVRACYAALRMQESVKKYAKGVWRSETETVRDSLVTAGGAG